MRQNSSSIVEHLVYTIIFLVSLISLLASINLASTQPFVSSFLHELSFAGFIALIVILTVEKFTRARHSQETNQLAHEINKNLFNAIYRRYVPPSVFREAESLLLGSEVHRTNHSVAYIFRESELSNDRVGYLCQVHTSSELVNTSTDSVRHVVRMRLERPMFDSDLPSCGVLDVTIGGIRLPEADVLSHSVLTEDSLEFSYLVRISGSSRLKVEMSGTVVKELVDTEIWTTSLPSDGLKLSITTPDDVQLGAKSIHSQSAILVRRVENTSVWEINGGLLPHQGMTFWWRSSPK